MSKVFRPYEPDQIILMPASMQEWLPSDHLVYFISDVVDHLWSVTPVRSVDIHPTTRP